MLSLSQCKCQRATPLAALCPTLTQCRNTHNNGNERRNMAMQMLDRVEHESVPMPHGVITDTHTLVPKAQHMRDARPHISRRCQSPRADPSKLRESTVYYFSLLPHLPPPKTSITPPLKMLHLFSLLPHVDQSRS